MLGVAPDHYRLVRGGSVPVPCWRCLRFRHRRLGRGPNPKGGESDPKCAAPISRNRISACSVPSTLRTSPSRGSFPRCPGNSVTRAKSAIRTYPSRRRTHRTAPGSSMSGRIFSVAFSMLSPAATLASTMATTCSTSSRLPGSRLARQSGSRLNVVCPVGQYQREICVPGGSTRGYVPCRAKPQPPRGCSGQQSKLACRQYSCLT